MEPQVNSFVYMLSWYLWNTDHIGILLLHTLYCMWEERKQSVCICVLS